MDPQSQTPEKEECQGQESHGTQQLLEGIQQKGIRSRKGAMGQLPVAQSSKEGP